MVREDRRNFVIQNLTLLEKKIIQRLSLEFILLGDKMQLFIKIVETISTFFHMYFMQRYRIFFFPGKVCALLTNSFSDKTVFFFFRFFEEKKKTVFFFYFPGKV